jgi:cellulose synthase/poly-beta-1,6-N-acetylglucosamine synthase-like glycosyltransferase
MSWYAAVGALEVLFFAYFAALNLVYLTLNLIAARVIGRDTEASATWDERDLSTLVPPVSLLVPAYDEAPTIAASVRSMLQLEYPEFEIVVVNDGSTDGTLEVLRREFDLIPFPEAYRISLPTRPVRAVYRSLRHRNLRVVDKANGGKADALNAGLNAARYPLYCGVDADSVLQRDSLFRVVRPFLEDPSTIACGGTVRVANGCRVRDGFVDDVDMPRGWLARVQVVEYLRAFLFGRLGWSPLNAMLIVSGAFGLFRRSVVIEAGGYATDTVGEDMELVVRLHRLHRLARKPYRIVFVPDPICWTEAPEKLGVLRRQRMRWQRGLLESLAANRRLLLHPRGGAPGWLAFPFFVAFEAIGPVVEVAGYLAMGVGVALGFFSWHAFAPFLCVAVGMGILLSASALLLEEVSFQLYKRPRHLAALVGAILVENLGFRQLTAVWRLLANVEWLAQRRRAWGDRTRTASWDVATRPAPAAGDAGGTPEGAAAPAPAAAEPERARTAGGLG